MTNTSVVLCGHGTRVAEGAAQFVSLAKKVALRMGPVPVVHAFMELSLPPLAERLDELYAAGSRSILVVPAMLLSAGHAKTDIPALMQDWQKTHQDAGLLYGRPLGLCPSMLDAARGRIEEALAEAPAGIAREDTLLLVVGRGSSDPDANADAAKLARLLWEGMGFAWGDVGYFAVTFPNLDAALDRAASQGLRRVVVAPYLLFDGVLVRHLDQRVAVAARRHPGVQFVTAGYLNDHDGVVDVFIDRIREGLSGDIPAMNCTLCKHRAPVLAFDADVGAPQLGDDDPRHRPSRHPFAGHPHGPGGG